MVNKKLKDLTWKYFWQQKVTEITLLLLICSAIIFIPYLLGHNIGNNAQCIIYYGNHTNDWDFASGEGFFGEVTLEECSKYDGILKPFGKIAQWFEGLIYSILIALALLFSGLICIGIFIGIYDWVEDNWKKAKKRAKKELNDVKKNK